jgi:FkbM family methyltransferase
MRDYFFGELLIRSRLLRFVNTSFRLGTPKGMRIPQLGKLGRQNLREMKHGREVHLDRLFPEAFRRHTGTFVDVGVNSGQTLVKVKGFDRVRAYVGFEPNPSCNYYTGKLIDLNGFEDCTLVPVGLHERTDLLPLHMRWPGDDPTATLVVESGTHEFIASQVVPVWRGDDALDLVGVTSISVLKIDVEGAELEVLRGFAGTIERLHPLIVCEILPERDAAGITVASVSVTTLLERARAMTALLRDQGYRIGKITGDGAVREVPSIEHDLEFGDTDTFDFVFVPPDQGWVFETLG